MRRRPVLVVALFMLTAACVSAEPTETSSTTANTTSTSSTQSPTTTTSLEGLFDSDYVYLVRVDPGNLKPDPDFDPIPMKDYLTGDVSPNGRWIAGIAWDYVEPIPKRYLRLIDVEEWTVILDLPTFQDDPILADDDGSIYWSAPGQRLKRIALGSEVPEVIADYPPNFTTLGLLHMTSNRMLYTVGATGLYEDEPGETLLVGVDVDSGELDIVPLDRVLMGGRPQEDPALPANVPFDSFLPAVVWDDAQNRVLVVHAEADLVTEVNLETGGTSLHRYAPQTSLLGSLFAWLIPPVQAKGPTPGTERSAVLSRDGRYLYVATKTGMFRIESEKEWSITTESLGVDVIDTTNWRVVNSTDEPISTLWLSPDGAHLFGAGFHQFEGSNIYEEPVCSDLYLFEAQQLTERLRLEPTPWCGANVSFSSDSRFAYVLDGDQLQTIDIVDLESGSIANSLRHLGTRSPGGSSIWSPADVMGIPPGIVDTGP